MLSTHYRLLATSHFEPTYARRAFPCFDEPELKAKFLMTITHNRGLQAFFNMPKKGSSEVRNKPDLVRDEFEETVEVRPRRLLYVRVRTHPCLLSLFSCR